MKQLKKLAVLFLLLSAVPCGAWAKGKDIEYRIPKGWVKVAPGTTETPDGKVPVSALELLKLDHCRFVSFEKSGFKSQDPKALMAVITIPLEQGRYTTLEGMRSFADKIKKEMKEKKAVVHGDKMAAIDGTVYLRFMVDIPLPKKRTVRVLKYIFENEKDHEIAVLTYTAEAEDFKVYGGDFLDSLYGTLDPRGKTKRTK
jgi:hypothetical protein